MAADMHTYYDAALTPEQTERYSRQLLIGEFGVAGQARLCRAAILIVGAGGLGSPAALYLAGCGVGKLGIVDYDVVELGNLHRQVAHATERVGTPKAESAARSVRALNDLVEVVTHACALTSANAMEIVSQYDVVLDASDNVATRYLLNDCCVLANKPLVSGSALKMEGQLTVYHHDGGPCYRCIFPKPPPPNTVANCSDAGVLGVVPGIIGTMQALEAIKIASGMACSLSQKMLLFDAVSMGFRTVKLRARRADCAVCGDAPTVHAPIDYAVFCGAAAHDKDSTPPVRLPAEQRVSASAYAALLRDGTPHVLLDVRDKTQTDICAFRHALAVPLAALDLRRDEVEQATQGGAMPLYVVCRSGRRSQEAVLRLQAAGYAGVMFNVDGGLVAWRRDVDPDFPLY